MRALTTDRRHRPSQRADGSRSRRSTSTPTAATCRASVQVLAPARPQPQRHPGAGRRQAPPRHLQPRGRRRQPLFGLGDDRPLLHPGRRHRPRRGADRRRRRPVRHRRHRRRGEHHPEEEPERRLADRHRRPLLQRPGRHRAPSRSTTASTWATRASSTSPWRSATTTSASPGIGDRRVTRLRAARLLPGLPFPNSRTSTMAPNFPYREPAQRRSRSTISTTSCTISATT